MKAKLLKYGVPALIGAAISLGMAWGRGLGASAAMTARSLSDGCFTTAVLMIGLGALVWVSTTGFFDIFSYAGKSLLVLFSPLKQPEKMKKFYEYKVEKEEKRAKADVTILLVGVAYLLLSLICLALYYAFLG